MKNKQQIEKLWNDAHTLRGDDRITFGAAVAKYGAVTVRRAMESGRVGVTWTVMLTPIEAGDTNAFAGIDDAEKKEAVKQTARPYVRMAFDFSEAKPEMKMQANGQQIG